MPTRRRFLKAAGTVAVSGGSVLGAASAASAAPGGISDERLDELPEHVSLTYDQAWLEAHQPQLYLQQADREKFIDLWGLRATSPEYDTDVGVFWASYTHQDGVTSYDSHWGDHEPCYCYVDSESGELVEVVATIYHWIAGKARAASVPTDGEQPRLRVMTPHHQYTAAGENVQTSTHEVRELATDARLRDEGDTTELEDWLVNGLAEDLGYGTVVNPWSMLARESWWQRNSLDFSLTETLLGIRQSVGIGSTGTLST